MGSVRSIWLRTVRDPRAAEAIFRHSAFMDRAPLELAMSARFFAPFRHQEIACGEQFERRARFSRAAMAGVPTTDAAQTAHAAFDRLASQGEVSSLLDTVRGIVASALCELTLGEAGDAALARAFVRDLDDGIKLRARRDFALRRAFARSIRPALAHPDQWREGTLLGAAREEGSALSIDERVDHVASVFLGTGSIQIADVVTHAVVLEAHGFGGELREKSAEWLVSEAIRRFPVNASVTRVARDDAEVDGRRFPRGTGIHYVPPAIGERSDASGSARPDSGTDARLGFGVGARACPARRFSLAVATALVARFLELGVSIEPGYQHRRSLAATIRARLGLGPRPRPTPLRTRLAEGVAYGIRCAATYPPALLDALRSTRSAADGRSLTHAP